MRQLILDFEHRDESDGTTFVMGVHERGAGSASDVRRVTFSHDQKASAPLVLDGYVLAVLVYALERVDEVIVKGPVSAKALRNAHIWAEAWHSWRPAQYRPVEIIPEVIVPEAELRAARNPAQATRAIATFSGGVDSMFLALRHSTGMLGNASFPLTDVVLVHGFDVYLENSSAFEELLERTKPLIDSLGLRVHVVRTNVKERLEQDWQHSHGALLASVLHQFSDRFEYGLIGSTGSYSHPYGAWGSTPTTDHLLSGGHFEIVHEGAGYTRTEKVELVAGHPIARRTVKVCWEGPDQGRNCGKCRKCVRTRLNFMAVGVPAPGCFDTPFDPRSISTLTTEERTELPSLLEFAERRGLTDEWVTLLRDRVNELSAEGSSERPNQPGTATVRGQVLDSQEAPSGSEASVREERNHRPASRHGRWTSEIASAMPFRERAEMYGHLVCSFIERDGPVWLLSEMAGNIGDHLIWAGTERLLDSQLVPFLRLPISGLTQDQDTWRGGTLVVPGSGAWTTSWHEWLPSLVLQASIVVDRVVVLPSSFDVSVPEVSEVLTRPNVYPFAREAESYRRIKPLGRAALALDPALYAMGFSAHHPALTEEPVSGSTLVALRTDRDSRLEERGWRPVNDRNDDISVTAKSLAEFLGRIRSVDLVVTDRLHVVVAAVMLGKSVRFVDPVDRKISRYVDFSFRDEFRDQLGQRDDQWLAAQGFVEPVDA